MVIDALAAEGIPAQDALAGVRLSREAMSSPAMRISLNQVIECYRNAAKLSRDPHFSYHTGLRVFLSAHRVSVGTPPPLSRRVEPQARVITKRRIARERGPGAGAIRNLR